jgi:hypothetical protein
MGFMENQVTVKQTWLEIDGDNGSTFVPFDVLTMDEVNVVTETKFDVSEETLNEAVGKYYEGTIHSTSIRIGYGARQSAPGYLDCTEWEVFDTEQEAEDYLTEMYGDDDELDEDGE